MTNEERDLITRFIERVAGASPGGFAGAVAPAQPLPPVDPEADALIADLFSRHPEARYRITQMAFVQEHALVEAQSRINRLQWELQQSRQAQAAAPQQSGSPWGAPAQPAQPRGFLSGLFGGAAAAPQRPQMPPPQYAPPPPQYPPGYNPGMFPQQGTGFFGSALRTAAGVAGGVLAADALTDLFSGHHGGGGWGGGGPGQVAEPLPGGLTNPWGGQIGADPADFGGAAKEPTDDPKFAGPADVDQSAWSPAPPDQGSGWQDAANVDPAADQGGGWDQASDDASGGGWSDDDIQNT
jgi:hypothetical protein